MRETYIRIGNTPAILLGEPSEQIYLFVHGKSGCKEEAKDFARLDCLKEWQILSVDLPEHGERKDETNAFDPWHVVPELKHVMEYMKVRWKRIALRANSIGAWFSMLSFPDEALYRCLFVSPILDMEQLIKDMMQWASVSEKELEQKKEIRTVFGETLSWKYYEYAKQHSIQKWDVPTSILYAGEDTLTQKHTVDAFTDHFHCSLAVMEHGEHWFHTKEQLQFLKNWETEMIEEKM